MKLKIKGKIYDGNKEIGSYGYSFSSCLYSWEVNGGTVHHFWTREELEAEIEKNGWRI